MAAPRDMKAAMPWPRDGWIETALPGVLYTSTSRSSSTCSSTAKRGDVDPHVPDELALRPEHQPADLRMQPVGADHHVQPAGLGMGELDARSAWVLMDLHERVVPQELGDIVAGLEQDGGAIRAWDLHLDPVRHLERP
jgi:hypothetical protein